MRRKFDVWTVAAMAVLLVLGFASNPAAWAQESSADEAEYTKHDAHKVEYKADKADKDTYKADKDKADKVEHDAEKTEHVADEPEKAATDETDRAVTAEEGEEAMQTEESQLTAEQAGEQSQQQAGQQTQTGDDLVMVTVSLPVLEATAGQIAATPAAYYGSVVRVDAEVESVLGGNSFTLDEDRIGAGPDVLVLAPRSSVAAIPEGEHVEVVGHLRPLVVSEFERDYDWFDLGSIDVELETRPVLIAASIRTQDGRELMASATGTATTPETAP